MIYVVDLEVVQLRECFILKKQKQKLIARTEGNIGKQKLYEMSITYPVDLVSKVQQFLFLTHAWEIQCQLSHQ